MDGHPIDPDGKLEVNRIVPSGVGQEKQYLTTVTHDGRRGVLTFVGTEVLDPERWAVETLTTFDRVIHDPDPERVSAVVDACMERVA